MTQTEQIIKAFYDAGYRSEYPVDMKETIDNILGIYVIGSGITATANFTVPSEYSPTMTDNVHTYICNNNT